MNENLLSSFSYIRQPEAGILQDIQVGGGLDSFAMLPMLMQGRGGGRGRPGRRGAPSAGEGGLDQLMIEQPGEGASTGLHLHYASDTLNNAKIAKGLESKGLDVWQLTGFEGQGPISGGHTGSTSQHYQTHRTGRKGRKVVGNAADVNYYGGGRWESEQEALEWAQRALRRRYGLE
jgi:hypothetical protein